MAQSEDQTPSPVEWDASSYDRLSDPMTRWGVAVLDRLHLAGHETVLDAGCGSGRVTEVLVERLPRGEVVGYDAAEGMLSEARSRLERFGSQVTLVQGDLLELSPQSLDGHAPVDAVLSTATFHWVLDHDLLFRNLASVMKPGAVLEAQCGAAGNIDGLLEAVRRVGAERAGTWNYATTEDTERRLRAAGFSDIDVWTHDEPTRLEPGEQFLAYLATVCLRAHVADMDEASRHEFLEAVADELGAPVIDYVRLNISARRS